jgi:DNA polymerase (family 10)
MEREAVAGVLERIGLLLELLGENPFKTRAYDNAARVIRGLDRDVAELVARRELTQVRGIGAAIADKVAALVTTGRLPYLEALERQVPPGLLDWLKVPGLGAKKARKIHVSLGIATLDELERACREGRLRELPGFGETSEAKILRGIERLRTRAGRFLRPIVQAEAERLLALVRGTPGVGRAEVGGSVRRRLETSKDIDIVATATDRAALMDAFAGAAGVLEVTGRGPTRCSVRLAEGPAADLRVVPEDSFGCALMYFTGSKAHNVAMRARAQRLGLKLNEYALVREADGAVLPVADEGEIYAALGVPAWIPPELREDQGEIEAAEAGVLPALLEPADLQGLLHVHSSWSDGSATIAELAHEARAMGLRYLAVCDHSKSAAYAGGLDAARVYQQQAEIDALNARSDGEFRILKGIEVDILHDGSLDFPDDVLARFELVIAAVHSLFTLDAEQQTARFLRAMDSPYVDALAHVTGRILLQRDGYPLDLTRVLDAAADRGIAVEVNAHPHRLDLDWRDLRYALKRGMKTCINPDAHSRSGLHDVTYGVDVARKAWCGKEAVLNAWPLDGLLDHIRLRRVDAGVRRRP